jgi:pyruvate dehydrogenase kinase 2/3/4
VFDYANTPESTTGHITEIPITTYLNYKDTDRRARTTLFHEDLKKRIANKIVDVQNFPYGLSETDSVKMVTSWYIQSFEDLLNYEKSNKLEPSFEYNEMIHTIFKRHASTIITMTKGMFEWRNGIHDKYGNDVDFEDIRISPMIKNLDSVLNKFYGSRTTIRLSILNHLMAENYIDEPYDMNIINNGSVVDEHTSPFKMATSAWDDANSICYRDFGGGIDHIINGYNSTQLDELLVDNRIEEFTFPYVPAHLYHILFEVYKNAIRATLVANNNECEVCPPVQTNIQCNQDNISVKVSDQGCGIKYELLPNIWSYFYSTADQSIFKMDTIENLVDFDRSAPIAGFGYGLPMSRLLARHFGGDLTLNSQLDKGSDVYVYIK